MHQGGLGSLFRGSELPLVTLAGVVEEARKKFDSAHRFQSRKRPVVSLRKDPGSAGSAFLEYNRNCSHRLLRDWQPGRLFGRCEPRVRRLRAAALDAHASPGDPH